MLSQAEIDALLSGSIELDQKDGAGGINLAELMDGSADKQKPVEGHEKKIQAYNFWSPDRFSKEQMRAIELIHEDLTERLTTSLPTFLRTSLRPRLVHTEQGRFHDFLKDLEPNTLFHIITLAPLPSQMVLTLSPNVSYMILEQRLGGKIEGKFQNHPLTEIDQSLLRGLVEHMLGDIKAAWSKVVTIEPTLEDSTTNQHWVQMMLGNERVMLLTLEVVIQGTTGTISIFIPFTTLKPIANVLNPHIWITGRKEPQLDPNARQTALKSLSRVILPIKVQLGATELAFGELLHIQIGDVVGLDTRVNDSVIVQVGEKQQFTGRIGKSGKHLAVQILDVIRETEVDPFEQVKEFKNDFIK
jgi:flagellar motor switch protein FliM